MEGTCEELDGTAVFVRSADLLAVPSGARSELGRLASRKCPVVLLEAGALPLPAKEGLEDSPPIVVVPNGLTYRRASRLVAEKALAQDAHVLAYGVRVNRALGEVLYRGSGLETMAREISRLARCPTFLLDARFGVLAYESLSPAAVPDPSELVRLLPDRLALASAADLGQGEGQRAFVVRVVLEDRHVTVVAAPMLLGETTYGWVVIVELEEPAAPHDVAQHKVIAGQGAMISGSEILRIRSVEAAEERARGDFVHALLHARFANAHELAARAAHHDFRLKSRYVVVVVEGALEVTSTHGLEQQRALVRSIADPSARKGQRTLTTTVGDLLVVVREEAPSAGATEQPWGRPVVDRAGSAIDTFASDLHHHLTAKLGPGVLVAYGRAGDGANGVHLSYREARIALGISRRLSLNRVCGYSELRVFAALSEVARTSEGIDFAREVLEPFTKSGYANDLEEVALSYVAHGGNLNAAARELQLHRNTMLYKVERASGLLGMDLRDPESRFTLWLAHRIQTLAEVSALVEGEFGSNP